MKIIVIAKANAKKTEVVRTVQPKLFAAVPGSREAEGELVEYKVSVTADPVNNRANNAIIAALADYFEIAPSRITQVSGQTSKRKVFAIA